MQHIAIKSVRVDGGTQTREAIDPAVVAEYADAIRAGVNFPPAIVYHDGTDNWLADGFHRQQAYIKAGHAEMPVNLRQGTQRDAILYSAGANASHGLRRTNADKRRAVMRLLEDTEWSKWSDSEIGRRCGVSHTLVRSLRPSLEADSSETARTYTTRHGTTATMSTAKIGRANSSSTPPAAPVGLHVTVAAPEPPPLSFADQGVLDGMANQDDDEIDPETGEPYPPLPPGDMFKEVRDAPEIRAGKLITSMHAVLVTLHDQGIPRKLRTCPFATRAGVAGRLRDLANDISRLASEISNDKADAHSDRATRRKTG